MSQVEQWLAASGATKIRQSGDNNLASTCPWCDVAGEWSICFAVNTDTGMYICYRPECGAAGHMRTILIDLLGYSRQQAEDATEGMEAWREADVDTLDIPSYEDRHRSKQVSRNTEYEATIGLYKFTPSYMIRRGFAKETLKRFEVGYDMDHKRVTFPVRDAEGHLLGYSTRATQDHDWPKYLHLGFRKSSVLYGESYAPKDARVLCVGEGNADALALQQLLPSYQYVCVATLGSLVSKAQVQRMFHYPRVLLAFDRDKAGDEATLRVGTSLEAMGHREVKVMRFAGFGGCKDPGEVLEVSVQTGRKARPVVRSFRNWLASHYQKETR